MRFVSSIVAFIAICVMFALIYVWQRNQVVKIGYRITEIEKQIVRVDEDIRHITSKINRLKSPGRILARIPGDLRMTSGEQIVHVKRIERKPAVSQYAGETPAVEGGNSWFWAVVSWLSPGADDQSSDDMLFARNNKRNKEE